MYRTKKGCSVGEPESGIGGTLRVRHHAEDTSVLGQDPRDALDRTVDVLAISEGDAILCLQLLNRRRVREVVSIVVRYREANGGPHAITRGERAVARGDLHLDRLADEAQAGVPDQRSRQQADLGEDLEAVADADRIATARDMGAKCFR